MKSKLRILPAKHTTISAIAPMHYFQPRLAGSPGDIRTPSVSDALLLRAIAKCGGEEIDLKVRNVPDEEP